MPLSLALATSTMAEMAVEPGSPSGRHLEHQDRPPAIKGNPAADPSLPDRLGRTGRRLFSCSSGEGKAPVELYASGDDFGDGRQSFYLRRSDSQGGETFYPAHGHFLQGGKAGVLMIHDGKGTRSGETVRIDQTVQMGLMLFRPTSDGLKAIIEVYDEAAMGAGTGPARLGEYACRGETTDSQAAGEPRSAEATRVRALPNSGATSPSFWYGEADRTVLRCGAQTEEGDYKIELLGAGVWPEHIGFLVIHPPQEAPPVGYNVHLLEGPGRLLVHIHSYPHRARGRTLDTMSETETAVGGLLLVKGEGGYSGWAGIASASSDPFHISFARAATLEDYAALGHAVIPPLPVTCQ